MESAGSRLEQSFSGLQGIRSKTTEVNYESELGVTSARDTLIVQSP